MRGVRARDNAVATHSPDETRRNDVRLRKPGGCGKTWSPSHRGFEPGTESFIYHANERSASPEEVRSPYILSGLGGPSREQGTCKEGA